jgi:hypothetical protein
MSDVTPVRRFSHLGRAQLRAITGMLHQKLPPTLLVVVLTLVSPKVQGQDNSCNATGDIPFTLFGSQCPYARDFCIRCGGPWGRTTDIIHIPTDANCSSGCQFYAADLTVFSPLGKWSCHVFSPPTAPTIPVRSPCAGDDLIPRTSTTFCQGDQPFGDYGVRLVVTVGGGDSGWGLSATGNSVSPPPCSSSVSSFLGDHPDPSGATPDLDTFLFQGAAGDQVTVRLEADPRAGHNGGIASLGGREVRSGLSLVTVGTLPLELSATLPTTGQYAVEVEQPDVPNRFRGSYILRIKPTTESIDSIEAATNVEK